MIAATVSEFRKNIKQYRDNVTENFETLIVNRGKNNAVVVISMDKYNSRVTTNHELSSKK